MAEVLSPIPWTADLEGAFTRAKAQGKLVLLEFSQAPRCAGSVALGARVYLHPPVSEFIQTEFVPVSFIRSERPKETARFNIVWTPTIIVADADGTERHRIVGFLPEPEFLAQLELGICKVLFAREQFDAAHRKFESVAERYRDTYAGPEAAYWSGVSEYKPEKNRDFLRSAALRLRREYPGDVWTLKASVWLSPSDVERV